MSNLPESSYQQKNLIGELLFIKVQHILSSTTDGDSTGKSDKITGMLLELDNDELLETLNNEDLLKQKVKEASEVLMNSTNEQDSSQQQKQIFGEIIYLSVQEIIPNVTDVFGPEKAGKITGMILELDNEELQQLVASQELLTERVKQAIDALLCCT